MDHRTELIKRLESQDLFCQDELALISDRSDLPPFIKQSVEVAKISNQTYVIRYSFFNRIIEYVLSIDQDKNTIGQYMSDGHRFDELHTNVYIGEENLSGKRNLYSGLGSTVLPRTMQGIEIVRIDESNAEILSSIEEELNDFESYEFIEQAIQSGMIPFYAAIEQAQCVAYLHMNNGNTAIDGKMIVHPIIFTCKSSRRSGIASRLLSQVISTDYPDCHILYGVDKENIASNKLARSIGLTLLGTKYRYLNQ